MVCQTIVDADDLFLLFPRTDAPAILVGRPGQGNGRLIVFFAFAGLGPGTILAHVFHPGAIRDVVGDLVPFRGPTGLLVHNRGRTRASVNVCFCRNGF
jgi:hypothetical protein